MRCDLHVHSWYSGHGDVPLLEQLGRECYSDPLAVYETARRRGMDLVTLTDHDTIEGALRLAHLPDAFVSEELTLQLDGGRTLHLNVYGIDERQHYRLQARRRDPAALFAFLAEQQIPAAVNHPFSALTGARTTVPRARSREQFLAGLRAGLSVPCGRSGSYARLTTEAARILAAGYAGAGRDLLAGRASYLRVGLGAVLVPLLPLVPLLTLAVYARELRFGASLYRAFQAAYGEKRSDAGRAPVRVFLGEAA